MSLRGLGQAPAPATAAPSRVTAGELVIDPPTLINLGFEWVIEGDANRNASVAVSYRKAGEASWKQAMPLLRLQGERVVQPNVFNLTLPNMFAGSILDLEPDTAYEARFVMTDPDGIAGPAANATKTVTVRTRPEPKPAQGGKVYHVYPVGYNGQRQEPSFTGLMCAYNYYCGAGDTAPGGRPRVKPGDTVLMHAGTYAYQYQYYANQTTINATTTFEGTYYLTADGTPDRPIVIRAAGDGEVIIDGRGNFNLFNVKAADYNYFEDITFRNTDIAIWAGTQFIAGSKGLTVKRCKFDQVGLGVFSNYSGSSNFYIADSTFLGQERREAPDWLERRLLGAIQRRRGPGVSAGHDSYTAIRLYGPGHVVAYNYVADFHDGIDTEMYGMPDGSHAHDGPALSAARALGPAAGVDRHLQQLHHQRARQLDRDGRQHAQHPHHAERADQLGIAPDVDAAIRRRADLLDSQHRLSRAGRVDPVVGGIAWRRLLPQHGDQRDEHRHRGESPLAQQPDPRPEHRAGHLQRHHQHAVQLVRLQRLPSEPRRGLLVPVECPAGRWRGAAPGAAVRTPAGAAEGGRLQPYQYPTLEQYAKASGQDRNSVLVDYDVFVNVPRLDRDPKTVQRLYTFGDYDFRLRPGSAAVDRGAPIPNVNDGFTGKAPDLGALEAGHPLPQYGPRPQR